MSLMYLSSKKQCTVINNNNCMGLSYFACFSLFVCVCVCIQFKIIDLDHLEIFY